ncbi:hypothetical protein GOBAR_AA32852 [Gossypium barbadense]|uniref:Uncharacterized protein n=1 Tax=Gossypium barbadense TaxID=3634 RepID=A0A2P5W9R3_GOSBA|nr:hypothetical protein GOBAR_AA32852 [Gossypium barbadense]
MLTKFILVSETCFQNSETALKNQQVSIQGLKTQIGQLAKLISEQPQGSLPSNIETNPKEQLHAITVHNDEGDDMIKRQACDSAKISSNRDDCLSSIHLNNVVAQTPLQDSPRKNVMEPHSNPRNKNRATHEERRLQIDELDEWRTYVKEKPKAHNESKRHLDKREDETTKFKVADKVLLDEQDP